MITQYHPSTRSRACHCCGHRFVATTRSFTRAVFDGQRRFRCSRCRKGAHWGTQVHHGFEGWAVRRRLRKPTTQGMRYDRNAARREARRIIERTV